MGWLDVGADNLEGSDDDLALWELEVECSGIQLEKITEAKRSDTEMKW